MNKRRTTMTDVAKEAGVSIATASYVLSGTRASKISPATQKLVLDAAEKLGYRPNRVARGLKTQRSYAVGVICSDIGFPLFGSAIKAIEAVLADHDYHVILHNTHQNAAREQAVLHFLEELRVDGAIFISPSSDVANDHLAEFARRVPFVLLNRFVPPDFPAAHVVIDHHQSGVLAAQHLAAVGRKRWAYLGVAVDEGFRYRSAAAIGRYEGFLHGAQGAGMDPATVTVHLARKGRFDAADGYEAVARLLQANHRRFADGLYVINDYAAAGALRALRENGLHVPGDVAVIGNDNVDLASRFVPRLTSISQQLGEAGAQAAKCLLSLMDGPSRPATRHTIQPRLIARESTVGADGALD